MLQRDNNDAYFGNLLQLIFFLFIFLRYRVTQSVRHFICAGTIREGIKCCLADLFRQTGTTPWRKIWNLELGTPLYRNLPL